jgi:hypothetical protein
LVLVAVTVFRKGDPWAAGRGWAGAGEGKGRGQGRDSPIQICQSRPREGTSVEVQCWAGGRKEGRRGLGSAGPRSFMDARELGSMPRPP